MPLDPALHSKQERVGRSQSFHRPLSKVQMEGLWQEWEEHEESVISSVPIYSENLQLHNPHA